MKRVLTLALPCLAAAMLSSSFASAQSAQKLVKPKVTLKATPKKDLKAPRIFRVRGTVVPTAKVLSCGAGVTNPAYCSPPPISRVCTGRVRVTVKRGSRTLKRATVRLTATCSYSARITIRGRVKRGRLRIRARFLGNTFVAAGNSNTVTVRV